VSGWKARYYMRHVRLLKRKRPLLTPPAAGETATGLARVITRDGHPISRSRISPDALRVLYRLNEAGYQAFLVGGCVRDLMIGLEPKDFDVATNARPEDVRRLFRNCRLVGRRFRLAHVFFGREIIEVATFRASSAPPPGDEPIIDDETDDSDESQLDAGQDDEPQHDAHDELPDATLEGRGVDVERVIDVHGRILRDNVYGSIDEDVWRRDFTANSLYYNIADFSVWDYCGGFEDVQARRLRLIGDPETRYREDPVRMLRAARFEAKLGFAIDEATAEPIARLRQLMAGVPPARLFDETLKLFLTGHGVRSFEVLRARGLLEVLLPSIGEFVRRHPGSAPERLLLRGLANTDARVQSDRPVTPTYLFALLLYGPVGLEIEKMPRERWDDPASIVDAVDAAVRAIYTRVAIPRRFSLGVRDMFALQPRLETPRGKRALRTLEHPRFRAAFDLLQLRAEFGMADPAIVEWWQRLQQSDPQQRASMSEALGRESTDGPSTRRGGRRRRRGGRRPRGSSGA